MTIITIDMRSGRSEAQKRLFARSILDVVSRATSVPRKKIYLVIRENPGINFVAGGHHLPSASQPIAPS